MTTKQPNTSMKYVSKHNDKGRGIVVGLAQDGIVASTHSSNANKGLTEIEIVQENVKDITC